MSGMYSTVTHGQQTHLAIELAEADRNHVCTWMTARQLKARVKGLQDSDLWELCALDLLATFVEVKGCRPVRYYRFTPLKKEWQTAQPGRSFPARFAPLGHGPVCDDLIPIANVAPVDANRTVSAESRALVEVANG